MTDTDLKNNPINPIGWPPRWKDCIVMGRRAGKAVDVAWTVFVVSRKPTLFAVAVTVALIPFTVVVAVTVVVALSSLARAKPRAHRLWV